MSRETLLAELHRLLDLGEPLLTLFPRQTPVDWLLQLPDNISGDMYWYANSVSWRARDREGYQDYCQHISVVFVTDMAADAKAGLLGWRAIGVLK